MIVLDLKEISLEEGVLNISTEIVPWVYGDTVVSHIVDELLLYFNTRRRVTWPVLLAPLNLACTSFFPLSLFFLIQFTSGNKGLWWTYVYILSLKLRLVFIFITNTICRYTLVTLTPSLRLVTILRLKNSVSPTIYPELEGESLDSFFSQEY